MYKGIHQIKNDLNLSKRLTDVDLIRQLFLERAEIVLDFFLRFYISTNPGIIIIVIILLTLGSMIHFKKIYLFHLITSKNEFAAWIAFAGCNTLIFILFIATPKNPVWHMNTAADRLLLLPCLLLYLICILRFDLLFMMRKEQIEHQ